MSCRIATLDSHAFVPEPPCGARVPIDVGFRLVGGRVVSPGDGRRHWRDPGPAATQLRAG